VDTFGSLDEKLLQQQLNETMANLELVRKNFEKYKEEMGKTNKILNEDIDLYRTKNSDLSLRLALAESKLESSLERCKTLNTNIEKCRKELETNKERNSKLNEIIIKHEQSINLTTQELNRVKEKSYEMETRLHSITLERDMYKSNQERLSKEHELLLIEKNSRNTIHSDLQLIRNSCERSERESKLIYSQKIEQLEKENLIKSKQIEHDKEQNVAIIKSWTSQYDQLEQQHRKANSENEKTRNLLNQTKRDLDELQQKYNEVEAKLHSNEMLVQMTRNTKSSSAISRLTHLEEETKVGFADYYKNIRVGNFEIFEKILVQRFFFEISFPKIDFITRNCYLEILLSRNILNISRYLIRFRDFRTFEILKYFLLSFLHRHDV
jgi:chromosome segregation ATPase